MAAACDNGGIPANARPVGNAHRAASDYRELYNGAMVDGLAPGRLCLVVGASAHGMGMAWRHWARTNRSGMGARRLKRTCGLSERKDGCRNLLGFVDSDSGVGL
jgi:hypothetical protein